VELSHPSASTSPSEEKRRSLVIPYPALQNHGLIGDRRTAAFIAADGTLDWLCLPDYDGPIIFGALLDWMKGGYWRLGPPTRIEGQQAYQTDSMVLETRWELPSGTLVLRDAMLWPETKRSPELDGVRAIVRCLCCTAGKVLCRLDLEPAYNFAPMRESFSQYESGLSFQLADLAFRLWSSISVQPGPGSVHKELELEKDQELWMVLELGARGHGWSVGSASSAMESTERYWRDWTDKFALRDVLGSEVVRTALIIHLLSYAPEGCGVAAVTTSLPERIGGDWSSDYRLSWIRDTSLALGIMARLGDWQETEQYLQWVVKRQSRFGLPLQVAYDVRGGKRPRQRKLAGVAGYRGSRPVRIGNHAYKQRQFGSLGFLADCTWHYVQEGGPWRVEYWRLIRRCADYISKHWTEPDNGIWELAERQHFVQSKVMCWVMLDRAIKIADKVNPGFDTQKWQTTRSTIHEEVMDKGWSERLGAFSQRYGSENVDAAELLISLMSFLPGDHPRVLATIERIAESLTIDGLVYRFNPLETLSSNELPLGEFEAAFLPCTFWLAAAYAKAGQREKARAILARVGDKTAGLGLLAEGIDPRTGHFSGNMPLLFSHVEYVRAKLELALSQSKDQGLPRAA
jgi:GH15 family glucan-1,4-alpha-glucosidase